MLQTSTFMELSSIEAKIFFGLTWRQLIASAILVFIYGIPFAAAYYFLYPLGIPLILIVLVPLLWSFPVICYGWYRPHGLMPEKYVLFVYRHYMSDTVIVRDGKPKSRKNPKKIMLNER